MLLFSNPKFGLKLSVNRYDCKKQYPMEINEAFVFAWIRKYNQARRQLYKDKALLAVGIHAGLLKKSKSIAPELSQEERDRVVYFLREFVRSAGIEVKIQ